MEDVSFPLDQGQVSSALRVLQESREENTRSRRPGAAGANELSRISEGTVLDPDERLREDIESDNDISNPDRINEFQDGAGIDSIQEGISRANDDATAVEEENLSRPLEGSPSISDVAESGGAGLQGRESLEESFNADSPSPNARSATQLEQRPTNDARIQQRIQEERVEGAEVRARNEPAIDTPAQTIDPVEAPEEPLEEALDNNPLRGPRPSELREEPDATATETERGQNISNLI
jgi:hypothetical protein